MRSILTIILLIFMKVSFTQTGNNNDKFILINNVQIFNGKDSTIQKGNVFIQNNTILRISSTPITTNKNQSVQVIDGKGKFLMPGLIDAHAHTMMDAISMNEAMVSDIGYINLYAANSAKKQLLRGFTTVRDLGGASLNLKKAIDAGLVEGPRIYPSGATISQSGGHGDFGLPTDVPRQIGTLSYMERTGMTIIADGVDQVLMRTRELLRNGSSQIKVMAGGGVASSFDPLDVMQYTDAELRAAVSAADNWGTYVTVHAYTPQAIKAAIAAGVKCIDHGQLADDSTAQLMAEKGIWWSLQPFLDDEDAIPFPEGSELRKKQVEMTKGTDNAYQLAKKYKVKTAWGTDCLFDAKLASRQGAQLAKMVRWYTPFEVLKMATADNASLLELSGKRNPYPKKLGVIQEGAYADMLIVDGNPIKNISLLVNPEKNILVIIKNGVVYKNILSN